MKKKRTRLFIPAVILIILLIGAGVFYAYDKNAGNPIFSNLLEAEARTTASDKKDNSKPQMTEKELETAGEAVWVQNTEPPVTEAQITEALATEAAADGNTESEAEMFADALFIGDSRTEGFVLLSGIQTNYYAYKGLNVSTVYTEPVIQKDGASVTVMDAVADTEFCRIYMMFGVNETGWMNSDIFIDNYKRMIADIRETHPDAEIYIQSILPVSQSVSDTHRYVKNDTIKMYNELLQNMAKEEKVHYINVAEAVSDSGVLPDNASSDGIHLNQEYCQKWLDYLIEYRKQEVQTHDK